MQPQKDVPNPLLELGARGALDILDELDLGILLSQPDANKVSRLADECKILGIKPSRVQHRTARIELEWKVSLRELLSEHTPIVYERPFSLLANSSVMRDGDHEPNIRITRITGNNVDEDAFCADCSRNVVVGASVIRVRENEFQGILREDLKIGSSLHSDLMEARLNFGTDDQLTRAYRSTKEAGVAAFFCATTMEPLGQSWRLQPELTNEELLWVQQTAFMAAETLDVGTFHSDDGFVYIPEHHGMAQYIKAHLPSLVSAVRCFALSSTKSDRNVLRINRHAFEDAKQRVRQLMRRRNMEQLLSSLQIYMAYKERNEEWEDEHEKEKLLLRVDLDEKRAVKVELTIGYLRPGITVPGGDRFFSDHRVIGNYAPGVSFIDVVSCKPGHSEQQQLEHQQQLQQQQQQQWDMPTIVPVHLAEYLEKNHNTREAIKKGNPPEGYRADVPYSIWAKELASTKV